MPTFRTDLGCVARPIVAAFGTLVPLSTSTASQRTANERHAGIGKEQAHHGPKRQGEHAVPPVVRVAPGPETRLPEPAETSAVARGRDPMIHQSRMPNADIAKIKFRDHPVAFIHPAPPADVRPQARKSDGGENEAYPKQRRNGCLSNHPTSASLFSETPFALRHTTSIPRGRREREMPEPLWHGCSTEGPALHGPLASAGLSRA